MSRHLFGLVKQCFFSAAALCICSCSGSSTAGSGGLGDMGVGDLATGIPSTDDMGSITVSGVHATQSQGRYFPDSAPWYQDVSSAPLAADSDAITQWMVSHSQPNGWGTGKMKVDFSIAAVNVPSGTAKRAFTVAPDFNYSPDCDSASVPLPSGGVVESYPTPPLTMPFSGYQCSGFDAGDDCHILLVARAEHRLYELYHATVDGSGMFRGGCLAIWDTRMTGPNGRGSQCTSADAAGFPMSALLFSADEIKAGVIDHAIRFILPNDMIRQRLYVMPATHGTNTTGPTSSGPYGFRMRLKADYLLKNPTTLSSSAQVVAKALQKYGMLMSDGGNLALTAQNDALSAVKWTDVGFDSNSLSSLKATDFEVVDSGAAIAVGASSCTRTPIIEP